ncbi:leucine-rich repeat-containing protein 15-like [Branchiostoma lanceolatum]|uniref:leucine-rich repeat-containing protein 15-like n=1 Tax=Branchiostoma lanceolatum TaxID=7740 RepID=UPI003455C6C6
MSQSAFVRYRSLVDLDLSQNHITYILPRTFSNLLQLQMLTLSRNKITNILPGTISHLPQLQRLCLDYNQITTIQTGVFSNLSHLRQLLLSFNQITTIQPHAFLNLLQLRRLMLSSNQISNIQSDTFSNLPRLQTLALSRNKIINIQPSTFSNLPQLRSLSLHYNQITNILPGAFSNISLLQQLYLNNNKIKTIQSGAFSNLPKLEILRLHSNKITTIQPSMFSDLPKLLQLTLNSNRMVTLPSTAYSMLSAISSIRVSSNPWQCNCSMLPFRLKMSGSQSFENQITCSQPAKFQEQKLKDISPEDLNCEEPTIVSFQRANNNTLVQGNTLELHLVCEASGIPQPDITVTLPSGLNANAESGGRVTVDVNGTIAITNVTAADAGQYICTAGNPAGYASSTLSVDVLLNLPKTTTNASPLSVGTTGSSTHLTSNGNLVSSPTFYQPVPAASTFSSPVLVHSPPSEEPESHPNLPVSVPIATIAGAAAGTVLIGSIVFTICWKRWTRNRSVGPDPGVVSNSTDTRATVTTRGAPDTTVTVTTDGAPDTRATVTTGGAPDTTVTVTTDGAPDTTVTVTTDGAPDTMATVTTGGAPDTTVTVTTSGHDHM